MPPSPAPRIPDHADRTLDKFVVDPTSTATLKNCTSPPPEFIGSKRTRPNPECTMAKMSPPTSTASPGRPSGAIQKQPRGQRQNQNCSRCPSARETSPSPFSPSPIVPRRKRHRRARRCRHHATSPRRMGRHRPRSRLGSHVVHPQTVENRRLRRKMPQKSLAQQLAGSHRPGLRRRSTSMSPSRSRIS